MDMADADRSTTCCSGQHINNLQTWSQKTRNGIRLTLVIRSSPPCMRVYRLARWIHDTG